MPKCNDLKVLSKNRVVPLYNVCYIYHRVCTDDKILHMCIHVYTPHMDSVSPLQMGCVCACAYEAKEDKDG